VPLDHSCLPEFLHAWHAWARAQAHCLPGRPNGL
jgi:hypothetical protein